MAACVDSTCFGTCMLLASTCGFPIRPVLKHGPRSLTCVRVNGGAKPEETLVEARSDTDVQIVRLTWVGRHGCSVEPCHGIESSKWAIFGKQNWRCGMNRKLGYGAQLRANLDPTKGVGRLRQQDGGHGSRNPLRRGRDGRCKTRGASLGGAVVGADLGGSSKYSNENFEGRRGERFHVNGTCTWPAHPGNGSAGGRVQRLEEHRTSRGVSKVNSLWSMEQCRQGKSAKWIRNLGKRIGSEGWARGSQSRTRRLSVDCSSCSRGESGSPRAGRGTDWERALRGLFPGRRTVDSELCSECQSEEIQPSAGKRRE
ncbi:hypothetical protein VNO77_49199 [Canavalia gladiata]|uniref:Uncharacterized protein n=2 Tax=Canavalia gladiata TaxID=3824 RepID=A0AAN9JEM7_CANGL